jgi:hypothetical protein
MRVYNFRGQGIILNYQIVNNGIEISTVINGKVKHALYSNPELLKGYDELIDLVDDLSEDFIKRLESEEQK